jgi:serine O-acetyltransferase
MTAPDGEVAPLRSAPAAAGDAAVDAPGAWRALRADVARYFRYARIEGRWERIRLVIQTEAIWAIATYRAGRWLRGEAPPAPRRVLRLPYALVHQVVRLAVGIYLDPGARIGPGLYIGHSGGIWVAPGAVIGRDCNLSQGVTIGIGGTVRRGTPTLGDRVWIGPKATVSGPIRIGSGAVIGANSLAVTNVPEKGVAVGIPARVVATSGSGALIG